MTLTNSRLPQNADQPTPDLSYGRYCRDNILPLSYLTQQYRVSHKGSLFDHLNNGALGLDSIPNRFGVFGQCSSAFVARMRFPGLHRSPPADLSFLYSEPARSTIQHPPTQAGQLGVG